MAIEAKTDDKRTNVLLKKETPIDELFKFKNQGIILGRTVKTRGWMEAISRTLQVEVSLDCLERLDVEEC